MTAILRISFVVFALCACVVGGPSAAGGSASSSFNLFTPEQDVEIGKQSAAEAEKQLPMLGDAAADRYVDRIVQALAAQAPGAKYPYRAKTVNDATINAFALPGGPLYVNRGLIDAARSEDELASVMAHEVAHVALRHGTHQASKAYLAQAGLGILGGLLGQDSATTAQVVNVVGGVGLNALFLKYSRDAESEADATGAQIMARAGYDPDAMADFFALLREKGDQGSVATFFSDHPAPADREARIRQIAATLPHPPARMGGLAAVQAELRGMPPAPASQLAQAQRSPQTAQRSPRSATVQIAAPSSQFKTFNHPSGFFSIEYPANWEAHAGSGDGASVYPPGGAVDTGNGEQTLLYGVVVNHYVPFEAGRKSGSLAEASDDLVQTIQRANSYLTVVEGSARREQIDGAPAMSVVLAGRSPITNATEQVSVVTRALSDGHIVYALLISPERDHQALAPAFTRMVKSLAIHDVASHR